MNVTREQAEQVLAAVRTRYAAYCNTWPTYEQDGRTYSDYDAPLLPLPEGHPDLPVLVEDYQFTYSGLPSGLPCWAIVWECGPFEWAQGDIEYETVNEELTAELATGVVITDKAVKLPAGVFCEAIYSYVLGIYEG